jgi:hypothetical protein
MIRLQTRMMRGRKHRRENPVCAHAQKHVFPDLFFFTFVLIRFKFTLITALLSLWPVVVPSRCWYFYLAQMFQAAKSAARC